jgi:hypothetical protein
LIFSFLCSVFQIIACPFVLFLLAIELSGLLWFTTSDYTSGIFKHLFLESNVSSCLCIIANWPVWYFDLQLRGSKWNENSSNASKFSIKIKIQPYIAGQINIYISNVSYFYIIITRFSIKGLKTESDVVIYWYNNGISTVSIIGVIFRVVRGGKRSK